MLQASSLITQYSLFNFSNLIANSYCFLRGDYWGLIPVDNYWWIEIRSLKVPFTNTARWLVLVL